MPRRSARPWLYTAIVIGLAVRVYLAGSASVIARDGVIYVSMARDMVEDWRAGVPHPLHFGYPLLIRCLYPVVGGLLADSDVLCWQRTGQLISILFGLVCIPLIYWLGRHLFGRRVGLLAAWVWALLPDACRLSADALTDMPHLALVLAAAAATMIGLRSCFITSKSRGLQPARRSIHQVLKQLLSVRGVAAMFWAGLLSGAAYALRPEGGEIALVAVVLALTRRRAGWRGRVTAAAAVILGFAVLGGSYILAEGGQVFSKKSLVFFSHQLSAFSLQPSSLSYQLSAISFHPSSFILHPSSLAGLGWVGAACKTLIVNFSDSLNGVWLVLGLAYPLLPGRPKARRRWVAVPLALLTLHMVVLVLLYQKHGYISHRHVMLPDVGLVILAAAALSYGAAWLSRRGRLARGADGLALGIIVLGLTPWILRDINHQRTYVHDAAAWVKQRYAGREPPTVIAQYGWVPFYAGLREWSKCPELDVLPHIQNLAVADLVILDIRETSAKTLDVKPPGCTVRLTESARFVDADGRGIAIYRVQRLDD